MCLLTLTPQTGDDSKEYQEGWDAYLSGLEVKDCPYYYGTQVTTWIKGYCDAERWGTS